MPTNGRGGNSVPVERNGGFELEPHGSRWFLPFSNDLLKAGSIKVGWEGGTGLKP